jgi:hypothetical protein
LWDIEEVGCQAHEKSLWVRELLGIDFLKVLNYNYRALRLLVHLLLKPEKEVGQPKEC